MNIVTRCICFCVVVLLPYNVLGASQSKTQNYIRVVSVVQATDLFPVGKKDNLIIAGLDLTDYGYVGVTQYAIDSSTFTLFVLGDTLAGELMLSAINLTDRSFTVVTKVKSETRKRIRQLDINLALCFQDHPYSHERLRYLFLTYIVGSDTKSETSLKVFRMENDDSLTFREMAFTSIGETDMVYTDAPDAPYAFSRQDNTAEPGIQIVPRLVMADVNHDKFMDLVIWRRIYLANPRDAEAPLEKHNAYEQHVFKHFTRDREEVQVMFFDWEQVSFAEPVITQTEGLGNDVFWRFLFPSYWFQEYYDWMDTPAE